MDEDGLTASEKNPVLVATKMYNVDVICHIGYKCQPWMHLWFAEMLTANVISLQLGYTWTGKARAHRCVKTSQYFEKLNMDQMKIE